MGKASNIKIKKSKLSLRSMQQCVRMILEVLCYCLFINYGMIIVDFAAVAHYNYHN